MLVVAVFLAYNANNGLPSCPTHSLYIQVANGAELVKGNEVREGGFRVGVVEDMVPMRLPNGHVVARMQAQARQEGRRAARRHQGRRAHLPAPAP